MRSQLVQCGVFVMAFAVRTTSECPAVLDAVGVIV